MRTKIYLQGSLIYSGEGEPVEVFNRFASTMGWPSWAELAHAKPEVLERYSYRRGKSAVQRPAPGTRVNS